ncbi:hypothetical protein PSTG_03033 [Puccinia striiformis f. sp. tritici PST-78]|uniref:Uncharacterized protein n=1 Tax=Puccinia striiformis f. sp. tritici PST-78 TaxID=1165861 RepID=A0A0L0VXF3_9BASI|nr:hypothetical protein PSTG_03033 [Puccinia striiformis f. sp. tritici PST-78]
MIHSDFEASAIYDPEVRGMERLNRLMAESSIYPRHDLLPYHSDPHLLNESLLAEQQVAMQVAASDMQELALLDHENRLHLRDRELSQMSLINDEMQHLNLLEHQIGMERAMALDDEHRMRLASGYGVAPGYGIYGGSAGYGLPHGAYPAMGMVHPSYHSPAMHYPSVMADPYYQQLTSILPRSLPLFSDPYFMNQMALGSGHARPSNYAMQNPFLHGIDHNYGYGAIPPLSNYGLCSPPREYGQMLDDLYLYEMMLRLDHALDEGERMLRWRERLAWEELSQMERQLRWERMDIMERSRLGLGMGSFWGHQLGGFLIDSTFGYASPMFAEQAMCLPGRAPIMGILDGPHFPLSSPLTSTYPMWDVGGLGVGARISPWLMGNEMYLRPKHHIRRENIRREYAERRGEIPPVPRLIEPGRMGSNMSVYGAYSDNYRGSHVSNDAMLHPNQGSAGATMDAATSLLSSPFNPSSSLCSVPKIDAA